MSSKLIYLASPYNHSDNDIREKNFREVSKLAAKLCSEGKVALSPITYGHTLLGFHDMPNDWEFWKNFCLSFLKHCDEIIILMLPGWEQSRGVQEEIQFADKYKIKITFLPYNENL